MDKKSFWENKIQTWEIKRYGNRSEIIDGGAFDVGEGFPGILTTLTFLR
jgi:hypothetical protein